MVSLPFRNLIFKSIDVTEENVKCVVICCSENKQQTFLHFTISSSKLVANIITKFCIDFCNNSVSV